MTQPEIAHRVETHEQLLQQADEQFELGNMREASLKAWEALKLYLKRIAESRGWRHRTESDLYHVADDLAQETDCYDDIRLKFMAVSSVGSDFYESAFPESMVGNAIKGAHELIAQLENRTPAPPGFRPSQTPKRVVRERMAKQALRRRASLRWTVPTEEAAATWAGAEAAERLLGQAEDRLEAGDLPLSSATAWEAVEIYLKTAAKFRQRNHKSHSDLSEVLVDMARSTDDSAIARTLYGAMLGLYANANLNCYSGTLVSQGISDARELIYRLEHRRARPTAPGSSEWERRHRQQMERSE